MAITTREDFISVLQKSGLLTAARLEEARRLTGALAEPSAIAKKLVQQNFINRWQAIQLLAGRHSLFINKYRLLDLIGNDALGPIYLAEHTQMDRRVVLKTLAKREGNSAGSIERFLSETAALATLDHRHLSHVYDVDREGDFYYLVMEHVQGRNLQQVVESDGPQACDAAAGLVALAADAMGHAHKQGILHLGLRPDRLVVDGQGMLKVLDIGIARLADKQSPDGSTVEQSDKFAYRAPEQASDAAPDARADVYALGAVLYLLLTGEAPPTQGSAAKNGGPPRLSPDVRGLRPDVPVELAQICHKMMARRPQDRYASAEEAAAALENWLQVSETARTNAHTKAAAKPRGNGEAAPGIQIKTDERPSAAVNLRTAVAASGEQPAVAPRKPNRRMQFVGIAVGVGLLAIVISGVVLYFRSGGGSRGSSIASATSSSTTGAPSDPAALPENSQRNGEPEQPEFIALPIVKFNGPAQAIFTMGAEHSAVVNGKLPPTAEYQLVAKIDAPQVTGVKLEVFPHFVPRKNKNEPLKFRLSEIKIETAPDEKFASPTAVKIAQATADFDEPKLTAPLAFDGNRNTHWGADSQANRNHWAIFWFEKPLEGASAERPVWIRATLDQNAKNQAIYQLRLSAATRTPPESLVPNVPPLPPVAGATDAPRVLAYWRFEKPTAAAAGKGPPPAVEDVSESKNHLVLPADSEPARFSASVAGAKVRSTGEPNGQCLDDLAPAKKKGGTWGLATMASRTPLDLASQRLEAWTIEASFFVNQLGGITHTILGKDGTPRKGAKAPLQLRVRGDSDKIEVVAVDSTDETRRVESTTAVVPGRWYHVAVTSDGKRLRLWVDDGGGLEPQGAGDTFTGALAQGVGEWSIGRGFSDGQPADDAQMLIDEVRISAGAREPTDMLMYATFADLAAEKAAPVAVSAVTAAASTGPIKFHELKVLEVKGPEGVEFLPQDDGSYLVTGASPEKAAYTVRAHTELTGISGFRLEAMADTRLPGHGPGRFVSADKNMQGNYVVTELIVTATARETEQRPAPIAWKKVEADFSQKNFDVAAMTDGKPGSGWAISPEVGKGHYAMLTAQKSVGYTGGTWLTLTINQDFGKGFTLGRFRLTAFTGDGPGEAPGAGILAANQNARPLSKLPTNISLPELPAEGSGVTAEVTAAILLGSLFKSPGSPVALSLFGGDTAVDAEGTSFSIAPDPKSDAKAPHWNILLKSADAGAGGPTAIAAVSLAGNDLKFNWTEQGAKLPLANHLRNCVLEVKVSGQRRGISLRQPLLAERLDLGFGKSPSKPRYEIPWPPKLSAMKLSLPAKQAEMPPYALNHETIVVSKTNMEVTFAEQGQADLISVIECSWKKALQFNVGVFYLPTTPEAKRAVFNRAKVDKLRQQYANQLQAMKNRFAVVGPAKDENLSPRGKLDKLNLPKQITEVEATIAQITKVLERVDIIERNGGLPVRVFVDAGEYRLVLLQHKAE